MIRDRVNLNHEIKTELRKFNITEQRTEAPTMNASKWNSIFKLFDSDSEIKDSLLNSIEEGVNKSLPYEPDKLYEWWGSILGTRPYTSAEPTLYSITLDDIRRGDGEWNIVEGTFDGHVYLRAEYGILWAGHNTELYGDIQIQFKIVKGKVIFKLDSFEATAKTNLTAAFAGVRFIDNYIKLWINTLFWSDYVGSWNSGIESEIKSAIDGESYDATPWLIANGYYTPKD